MIKRIIIIYTVIMVLIASFTVSVHAETGDGLIDGSDVYYPVWDSARVWGHDGSDNWIQLTGIGGKYYGSLAVFSCFYGLGAPELSESELVCLNNAYNYFGSADSITSDITDKIFFTTYFAQDYMVSTHNPSASNWEPYWNYYEYGQVDLGKYNCIEFEVYTVSRFTMADTSLYLTLDGEVPEGYTMTIEAGPAQPFEIVGSWNGSSYDTIDAYWRGSKVSVYFDDIMSYGKKNIGIWFKTQLPSSVNSTVFKHEVTPLYAKLTTESEFLGNIYEEIQDTNNKITIIGDTVSDIRDELTGIGDVLTNPPDQVVIDKIKENVEFVEELGERDDKVNEEIDEILNQFNNASYDIFDTGYHQYMEDHIDTVFGHAGFLGFWNGLWNHSFVQGLLFLLMTFVSIGFVLYGSR